MRRRYWRASALAGLLGLITSVSTGMGRAFAHPVDDETDTEHAKEDLASTSIEKIEKQTKANATKIKEETGHTPGRKSDEQTVPNASCQLPRLRTLAREAAGARCSQPVSCRSSKQYWGRC